MTASISSTPIDGSVTRRPDNIPLKALFRSEMEQEGGSWSLQTHQLLGNVMQNYLITVENVNMVIKIKEL